MTASDIPIHWRSQYRMQFHEGGPDGLAGLLVLANYLQQTAGEHAEGIGLSAEQLSRQGISWVLGRQLMRIHDRPRMGDTVTVETWPSLKDRQNYMREYRLRAADDTVMVAATSAWILFDLESRTTVDEPPPALADIAWTGERAAEFESRTIPALREPQFERTLRPRWCDLDMNAHVNNAHLIAWCVEALPSETLAQGAPQWIDVLFRNECLYEDEISVRAAPLEDGRFRHSLVRMRDGKEVVRAESQWRDRVDTAD